MYKWKIGNSQIFIIWLSNTSWTIILIKTKQFPLISCANNYSTILKYTSLLLLCNVIPDLPFIPQTEATFYINDQLYSQSKHYNNLNIRLY